MQHIYKIIFPDGKLYIGRTSQSLDVRLAQHKSCPRKNQFYKAIQEHRDTVRIELIESCDKWYMGFVREMYWIRTLDTRNRNKGYNVSKGGFYDKTHAPGWKPKHLR